MKKKDEGCDEHEPLIAIEALNERYHHHHQQQQRKQQQQQHRRALVVDVDVAENSPCSPSVGWRSTTQRRPLRAGRQVSGDVELFPSVIAEQQSDASDVELDNTNSSKEDPSIPSSSRSKQRIFWCSEHRKRLVKQTMSLMNAMAKLLLWFSILATAGSIIWYSYELKNKNTEQHLIAWFSAGAFVILGFPVAIYGIFMHLTHYYQPHIQCYIVRILWMVPIYSIESWLCLRFQKSAIYIETLRDCYEAFVLYSFLQFLISVLGGETELILLLKEKSPTRGVHFNVIKYFIKPWIMGQPKVFLNGNGTGEVRWTSPFLTKCRFGVLQYVLLKYFCAIITMILEFTHLYKEGDFSPKSGYLYICIIINASQCWALYCLAFFYYATSNELAPIRPIGKFLSVKCLVFFTWWQSLGISILSYMGMIPSYHSQLHELDYTEEEVAKIIQAYLICVEMFGSAIMHYFVFPHTEFSDNQNAALSSRPTRASLTRYHRLGRHRKPRQELQCDDNTHEKRINISKSSSEDDNMLWPTEESGMDGSAEVTAVENPNTPAEHNAITHGYRDIAVEDNNNETCALTESELNRNNNNTTRDNDNSSEIGSRCKRKNHGGGIGFFKALLDSSNPRDVFEDSHGIVKGEYIVEKKTLLHHATASDEYSLFVPGSKGFVPKLQFGLSPSKKEIVSKRNKRRPTAAPSHQRLWEGLNDSAGAVFMPTNEDKQRQQQQPRHNC